MVTCFKESRWRGVPTARAGISGKVLTVLRVLLLSRKQKHLKQPTFPPLTSIKHAYQATLANFFCPGFSLVLLLLAGSPSPLQADPTGLDRAAEVHPRRPVSTVAEMLNLPGAEAAKGFPVRLEGRVIYADTAKGEVLLKDATGSIKINIDLSKNPTQAGAWTVVEGKTQTDVIQYPDHPSGRHLLTSFEAPTTIGNRFLARISGYLFPPRTGEYTFWIASDNGGELKLSTDESLNHTAIIAEVTDIFNYTGSRNWDKIASQRSGKILLRANHKYYIEALQWEEEGEDCLAVAWEGPGITRSVIAGEFLAPPNSGGREANDTTGSVLREFWLKYPFPTEVESAPFHDVHANLESILKSPPTFFGKVSLADAHLTRIEKIMTEAARDGSIEQAWPTEQDFNAVRVEGLVSKATEDGDGGIVLELSEKEQRMTVRLPNPEKKSFQHFLHSRVLATGFGQGGINEKGERVLSLLWVADVHDLSLQKPAAEDWSTAPAISIRELQSASSIYQTGQRIKISGQVLDARSDGSVILRDPVSRFISSASPDGKTWSQYGESIEIAMGHSVYAGLVALSPTAVSTGIFDHVNLSFSGSGVDVGNPPRPGSSHQENDQIFVSGTGHVGDLNGGSNQLDDFHFLCAPLIGDGELVARMRSLEPAGVPYPGVEAGIMIRDTLDPDSPFAYIEVTSFSGSIFQVRRGKGNPREGFPFGIPQPLWLKLERVSAPPVAVHFLEKADLAPGQEIEVMGVLERSQDRWSLEQAFFRRVVSQVTKPLERPESEILTVQQVRLLSTAELLRRPTAKLRGVVTAKTTELYLQDHTGGVRIPSSAWQKFSEVEIGQYIEVSGRCVPGLYSPSIEPDQAYTISVIGLGRMPTPLAATWSQLVRGTDDGQWVEVKGVVRRIDGRVIKLQMPGGDLFIDLGFERAPEELEKLIDATVRVQGVCCVIANDKKQLAGVRLIVPAQKFITVDHSPPIDPFSVTAHTIGSLLRFDEQSEEVHRVKVEGVVTYSVNEVCFVQNGAAGVEVVAPANAPLKPGDRVEVLGFPDSSVYSPILRDALIRRVGVSPLPDAISLGPDQFLEAEQSSKRVTLTAVYLGRSTLLEHEVFQFQRIGRVFQGILTATQGAELSLEPGSTVKLTGVCNTINRRFGELSNTHIEFELLLPSNTDLMILEKPEWWSLRHLLWVGGVFLAVILVAGAWLTMVLKKNTLLKHARGELQKANDELETRVDLRTADLAAANSELGREQALLRALLDSSPDEIYFKDKASRYLKASRAQAYNFGVNSPEELMGKTDLDFFGPIHAGLSYQDEQEIVRTGTPIIGQIRKEIRKNNRVHWMLSSKMPLRNEANEIVGTFGISKDITTIKEAEAKLETIHQQLVSTSHQAGMAEVATNVLHNVGNVLNSVNVSATLISDRVRESKIGTLSRVSGLLETHEADLAAFVTNTPQGKKLPQYLRVLADGLAEEQRDLLKELNNLCKNVGHIKEIVAMQQSYAQVSGVTETLSLVDLLEDAIRMNIGCFGTHGPRLIKDYTDKPVITVEKHKVIQILVNLLKNAKQACDESERPDKIVTIQVQMEESKVKVSIADNGVGIAKENLARIFSHGFTTRKDGHGFGLHSGALAAREMGGALNAYSEGRGRGATFVLEFPRGKADLPERALESSDKAVGVVREQD